jgi:DNA-directed RNA polymerase alpha subunit
MNIQIDTKELVEQIRQIVREELERIKANELYLMPPKPIQIIDPLTPIEYLDISVRAFNFIKLSIRHATTLKDLSEYTASEIFKMRGCGNKTVREIEYLLNNAGLTFKPE